MAQPKWKEVGNVGDVNWPEYEGGPVMIDETGEYEPELEYVEAADESQDVDDPRARWTVYRVVLDPEQPWGDEGDLESVAKTSGQDPEELRAAFASDDPMERAFAYETWAGHFGWSELDHDPLVLTCAEVNARYPNAGLNCYGALQSELEEEVERMADESSAESWSSLGDQMLSDLAEQGFDGESAVGIAEFGDAVAVNGDLLVDRGWEEALGLKPGKHPRLWNEVGTAPLETWLEANGYEWTRMGGRIPSDEGYASGEHAVRAVAKKLKRSEDDVQAAADALDWWQEEIPRGTSGHSDVWAKRKEAATTSEARRGRPEPTWVPPALAAEGVTPTMLEVLLHGVGEHARTRPGQSLVLDRDGYGPLREQGYIVIRRATTGLSSFGDYFVLTDKGADLVRRYRLEVRKLARPHQGSAELSEESSRPEPVSDPTYVIQGLYSNGYRAGGDFGYDDEAVAIDEAEKLARSGHFAHRVPPGWTEPAPKWAARVVLIEGGDGYPWTAKVYDRAGHVRSDTNDSSREYVETWIKTYFPGVPVERSKPPQPPARPSRRRPQRPPRAHAHRLNSAAARPRALSAARPSPHVLASSEVCFQQGERLRIRSRGAQGQPFESFWFTVPYAMTADEVALQFAQTGQPGMLIEIVSGKLTYTYQQGRHAGLPTVTRVPAHRRRRRS